MAEIPDIESFRTIVGDRLCPNTDDPDHDDDDCEGDAIFDRSLADHDAKVREAVIREVLDWVDFDMKAELDRDSIERARAHFLAPETGGSRLSDLSWDELSDEAFAASARVNAAQHTLKLLILEQARRVRMARHRTEPELHDSESLGENQSSGGSES